MKNPKGAVRRDGATGPMTGRTATPLL